MQTLFVIALSIVKHKLFRTGGYKLNIKKETH